MGIDIGFYNAETQEIEDEERFSNVPGFFAIAETFTKLLAILDENNVPRDFDDKDTGELYEIFKAYIQAEPDVYEKRFREYCQFICSNHEELEHEGGPLVDLLTGEAPIMPDPEAFSPEARAFMGRAILNIEPIEGEEIYLLYCSVLWVAKLFGRFIGHYREGGQTEVADHINEQVQSLIVLGKFLQTADEEERAIALSY